VITVCRFFHIDDLHAPAFQVTAAKLGRINTYAQAKNSMGAFHPVWLEGPKNPNFSKAF